MMEFTGKSYDDLVEGDIIRAKISISKKKRKGKNICRVHTFIVLNSPQPKSKGKRHKVCVPACSFSSTYPKGQNQYCIDLNDHNVPKGFFGEKKEKSILRISEPKCLNKFEYEGHINDINSYPGLLNDICNKVDTFFGGKLQEYETICDCECLKNNNVEIEYCEQDHQYLSELNSEALNSTIALVCSCCGNILESEECKFINCSSCNDNIFVIWRNNATDQTIEVFK